MRGHAGLFKGSDHACGHLEALLDTLHQNGHGVEVVLETTAMSVFGVGNTVAHVGNCGKFK